MPTRKPEATPRRDLKPEICFAVTTKGQIEINNANSLMKLAPSKALKQPLV